MSELDRTEALEKMHHARIRFTSPAREEIWLKAMRRLRVDCVVGLSPDMAFDFACLASQITGWGRKDEQTRVIPNRTILFYKRPLRLIKVFEEKEDPVNAWWYDVTHVSSNLYVFEISNNAMEAKCRDFAIEMVR